MKSINKVLITLLIILPFSGCAYLKGKKAIIKNRDMAYLNSHETAPIKLPENMNAVTLQDDLIIPPGSQTWNKQPPSIIPPGSSINEVKNAKYSPQKHFWSRWF
ncbi:MAG: hypothetical protein LEGION0398_MBIBDBAK_00444 [Legionellaceae bacterium]